MMNTTGLTFIFLWGLHVLSVIAFFTGLIFLIAIAIKTYTPAQLKSGAFWLIIIGTIACLFTILAIGRPWMGFGFFAPGMAGMQMQRMDQMMDTMMGTLEEHDGGQNDPEHMQMENMMREFRQGGRQGDILLSP